MRLIPRRTSQHPPKPWIPIPVTVRFGDTRVAGYVERMAGTAMLVQALEPLPSSLPAECEVLFELLDYAPVARGTVARPDRAGRRFRVSINRRENRSPVLLGAALLARLA